MVLTKECINVFYQPNQFIPCLSIYSNFFIEKLINKRINLVYNDYMLKLEIYDRENK